MAEFFIRASIVRMPAGIEVRWTTSRGELVDSMTYYTDSDLDAAHTLINDMAALRSQGYRVEISRDPYTTRVLRDVGYLSSGPSSNN